MTTPWSQEGDARTPELRRASAGSIRWWPKVDGANVALGADPAFTVHTPPGAEIQSGLASRKGVDSYSRVDVALAAIDKRDCGYQVRINYLAPGETVARLHVILFDVVEWPLEFGVSLNTLLGLRPSIGRSLKRMGSHLSPALDESEMAAHFIEQAAVELDARLRDQIRKDSDGNPGASRPSVILNRGGLDRYVKVEAMRLLFAADGANPEGDNEQAALLRYYTEQAKTAWRSLGPLEYDTTGDLVADSVERNRTRVVRCRRSY